MTESNDFHEPTPEQRDIVERAIKAGLDDKTIAGLLGITVNQLRSCYPHEMQSGSERIMAVVDALYERALEGNVPAIKLYLECRAGWIPKEKEQEIASKRAPLVLKMWTPEDHQNEDNIPRHPPPAQPPTAPDEPPA